MATGDVETLFKDGEFLKKVAEQETLEDAQKLIKDEKGVELSKEETQDFGGILNEVTDSQLEAASGGKIDFTPVTDHFKKHAKAYALSAAATVGAVGLAAGTGWLLHKKHSKGTQTPQPTPTPLSKTPPPLPKSPPPAWPIDMPKPGTVDAMRQKFEG